MASRFLLATGQTPHPAATMQPRPGVRCNPQCHLYRADHEMDAMHTPKPREILADVPPLTLRRAPTPVPPLPAWLKPSPPDVVLPAAEYIQKQKHPLFPAQTEADAHADADTKSGPAPGGIPHLLNYKSFTHNTSLRSFRMCDAMATFLHHLDRGLYAVFFNGDEAAGSVGVSIVDGRVDGGVGVDRDIMMWEEESAVAPTWVFWRGEMVGGVWSVRVRSPFFPL